MIELLIASLFILALPIWYLALWYSIYKGTGGKQSILEYTKHN